MTNYTKFKNALFRLEERYQEYLQNKADLPEYLIESMKESCIQRFEVCLDTAWKHLRKYLDQELGKADLPNSPHPIFKEAFANKIIEDPEKWIEFNLQRRNSSHDYSGEKADKVFEIIGEFIKEAVTLYQLISGEKWPN